MQHPSKKREIWTHTETQTHKKEGYVKAKAEAENYTYKPRNTYDC